MVVDAFHKRLEGATEKELADAARLEQEYECEVTRFGQGQLPDKFREYLKNYPKPLPMRWMSDLLIVRPAVLSTPLESIWLGDSKYQEKEKWGLYDSWVLEQAAHTAHRLQQVAYGVPNVYLWPDGITCSYVDDLPDEALIPGKNWGNGSGTPFWKVPKELGRPLKDVFGKTLVNPYYSMLDDPFDDDKSTMLDVATIANHPTVKLNFSHDPECWTFARYYVAVQAKSETLLSLLDMIEHWRTTPPRLLLKEVKWKP